MLAALKFVQGAVARKDLVASLTHFRIEKGIVRGYNGMLALCSPIPLDIECTPKAESMVKAISNCDETVQLSMTPAGRLSVRSGAFKAFVECIEGDTPHVEPEGEHVEIDGARILEAFKVLWPFVGDDASRPWSNGVLIKDKSAFATNNVMLVEYWIGAAFPHPVNIPRAAIKEMIRIGEAPTHAQMTEGNVTFHYSDGRWIRTQLFATDWPDLARVLSAEAHPVLMDERLFIALEKLKGFCDKSGRVVIGSGWVRTHDDLNEGASYEIPDLQWDGIYNIEMLMNLKGVAQKIDWSTYPSPCMFYGENLRGAIVGMRM
jgi:hypothetical protein